MIEILTKRFLYGKIIYKIYNCGALMKKTQEQIHYNMQRIRNKDSEIEILLRKALWRKGYRYRKNVKTVYGHPDIVFLRKKIAIF